MTWQPPETLETPRLALRLPTRGDIADIFEYASDLEVTRLMDWRRLSDPAEVEAFLERTRTSWNDGSEYTWVITERGADGVVGAIAIRVRPADADFGYVLNRKAWGRGIALEASRAIVDRLLADRPAMRVWATCDVENLRSARVLEKLGLRRERVLTEHVVRPNISPRARDSYLYVQGEARDPAS